MNPNCGHSNEGFADAERAAARLNSPGRDVWQRPEVILAALQLTAGMTVADVGAGTGYMVGQLSRAVGERGTVVAVDVEEAMVAYLAERAHELGPARVEPRQAGADDPGLGRESVDAVLVLDVWHHLGVHHLGHGARHHGKQHDGVGAPGTGNELQAFDRGEETTAVDLQSSARFGGLLCSGKASGTPQLHPRVAYAEKIFAALRPGGRLVVVESTLEAEVGPPVEMRIGPEVVERELVGAGFRVEVVRGGLPRHYLVIGRKDVSS
jgi:predicted methyltransferase